MAKFNPIDLILGAAMHANPVVGMIGGIVANAVAQSATSVGDAGPRSVIAGAHAPAAVAEKVMADVHDKLQSAGATIAPVKSGWLSKINWVQLAGPATSLLAAYGLSLKPDELVGLVVAVQTGQSVVTWIMRTWFTRSVTKASAG